MSRELQLTLAQQIITDLADQHAPWRRTWAATEYDNAGKINTNVGLPTNCVSGKLYSGINYLNLNLAARHRGYKAKWWGTRRQWEKLGGRVKDPPDYIRASDWAKIVCLYRPHAGGKVSFLKKWEVYNVEQVEGPFESLQANAGVVRDITFDLADEIILATGADIRLGGMKAIYFRPPQDYIQCPTKQQFLAERYFYSTMFHELVHWSECRLGWKGSYALGELVAEIGAVILCDKAGVPADDSWPNHMAYLKYWLKELMEDTSAIFRASTQAFKTAAYIFSLYERERMTKAA